MDRGAAFPDNERRILGRNERLDIGSQFRSYGEVRLGYQRGKLDSETQSGPGVETVKSELGAVRARLTLDRLDNANFPRWGSLIAADARFSRAFFAADEEYDRVYIDTPPNFNFYSKSALIAAHTVLVPFDCDSFARQSLYTLMDNIAELQEDHNPYLEVEGVVINQFQSRANYPRHAVAELREAGVPHRLSGRLHGVETDGVRYLLQLPTEIGAG